MILVCRPVGRGNWHCLTITSPAGMMGLVTVGYRFELGGIVWRVCEVRY